MIQARIAKTFRAGPDSPGFSLEVEFQAGAGVTALFGPSGAGKTLTLESIAGFVKPDSGRILLDDAILFDAAAQVNAPPRRRNCGYVFQNYALFPHMTLRQNLMFAAERRPRLERHRRVAEMLDRFHLSDVAGRRPHQVSGGQKQRCSIARALIGEPRLLLLDEPARGLDAPLRAELYALLRDVRAGFNAPILLVSHDLEECFALAGEMLVIESGRVVQRGAPRQILDQPASAGVARLLDIPNLFQGVIAALDPGRNTSRLEFSGFELTAPYIPGHFRGDRVWVAVRPEEMRVHSGLPAAGLNCISARLVRVSERPRAVRLEFSAGSRNGSEDRIFADVSREDFQRQDDQNRDWQLELPPHAIRIL
jgi:molybdate transport system ATP-binding protein